MRRNDLVAANKMLEHCLKSKCYLCHFKETLWLNTSGNKEEWGWDLICVSNTLRFSFKFSKHESKNLIPSNKMTLRHRKRIIKNKHHCFLHHEYHYDVLSFYIWSYYPYYDFSSGSWQIQINVTRIQNLASPKCVKKCSYYSNPFPHFAKIS